MKSLYVLYMKMRIREPYFGYSNDDEGLCEVLDNKLYLVLIFALVSTSEQKLP